MIHLSAKSCREPRAHRLRIHACEVLEDRRLLSINAPAALVGEPVASPLLSTDTWTSIGPAPVNMQFLTAPVSGRIAGLAADPTDPNVLYAAAAGGGVWKTIDAGASWAALTDSQQTLSMGAIAVAPSDASVIYAGTGEANFSGDSFYGRGVLVSHDFGANWVLTGNNEFDRRAISKIAIDPTNSSIAYAAVARAANGASGFGVYKTIDAGVHWANTTSAVTTTVSFTDVAIDPSDSNILYAAVGEVSGNAANGVYKSINAGGSWTLLANLPHGAQDGRITIAVAPTNADEIFVSIAGNSFDSGVFSFQRSDDGGSLSIPRIPPSCTPPGRLVRIRLSRAPTRAFRGTTSKLT